MEYCPKCQTEIDECETICPNCGHDFSTATWSQDFPTRGDIQGLLAALSQVNIQSRVRAAKALGREGRAAVPALIQSLRDSNNIVRARAAQSLAQIGDPQAINPLLPILKDPSAITREQAVLALNALGWRPRAVHEWADYLAATEFKLSDEILKAAPADAILPVMSHPEAQIRAAAAKQLGQCGGAETIPYLIQALADSQQDVREEAAEALEQLGWRPESSSAWTTYLLATRWAKPPVGGVTQSDLDKIAPPAIVLTTARVTSKGDQSEMYEALFRLLKHPNWTIREKTASLLGQLGSDVAVGPLLDSMNESHSAAAQALVELGWRPSTSDQWLDYLVADHCILRIAPAPLTAWSML